MQCSTGRFRRAAPARTYGFPSRPISSIGAITRSSCRRGAWWDANKIGLSPPPLETDEGWLILYHGVRHTAGGCLYRLGLALLDLEDPRRVLRRSDDWVFAPETPYERQGDVDQVVFPCGWILDRPTGTIRVYYGGADSCIALAHANVAELLSYLRACPVPKQ